MQTGSIPFEHAEGEGLGQILEDASNAILAKDGRPE